jgi:hypothetical protein
MNCILFITSSFVTLFSFGFILKRFDRYFFINFIHNLSLQRAIKGCYELNLKSLKSEIAYDFTGCLLFSLQKFDTDLSSMAFLKPNFHPFSLNSGKLYQFLRFYFGGLEFM